MSERLWKWLHELFDKPRCDMEVCLNPKHGHVHIQSGTGRAYVPMNLLIDSHMRQLEKTRKHSTKQSAKRQE